MSVAEPWPSLYAIVDSEACARAGRSPIDVAAAFLDAGVRLLQIRGKDLEAGELLALTRTVVGLATGRASVVVNDRADVAALAGAAGVHVGQDDLSVADARRVVGDTAIVGLSTHNIAQARAALHQAATYVAIGPVFGTGTKDTGYEAVGLDGVSAVADVARAHGVPVVAIGGITLERAPAVLAAGATAVCVIADLLREEPGARARRFLTLA